MPIIATYIVPHPPIIVPEVGHGDERFIENTIVAYHKVAEEIGRIKPDLIILSSPHAPSHMEYFHISGGDKGIGDFENFRAPQIRVSARYDKELVEKIIKKAHELKFPAGSHGNTDEVLDHGTMVPLYFIDQYYKDYHLIRVSPSGLSPLDHYYFGKLINSQLDKNQTVVWVASGDLSHKLKKNGPYGLAKEGPVFDQEIIDSLSVGDFYKLLTISPDLCKKAAECGMGSFTMMAGAIDGLNVESTFLSYQDTFGVGYLVNKYQVLDENKDRKFADKLENHQRENLTFIREMEDPYVKLARESLEYYAETKKSLPIPENLPGEFYDEQAGVFVSLHIGNQLRGCIGTIIPTKSSLAEEIISNAISAGMRDYRFNPVTDKELTQLSYSVDVLLTPEQIDSKEKLDINKYGVIVSHNHKTGLLLPNIDGINSVDEQIRIALKKAGIDEFEQYKLHRFEVIRHH